jgi:NADPH:quinone reductase-like Zn-dependent oxidoreductase
VRETIAVAQADLEPKPANLTFEQAASVPIAALTALRALRAGGIRAGQNVLIHGASGGVGSFAVQIAKALGAEVTGVCSTPNVEMLRTIGADRVVDYTREDFTRPDGPPYQLMIDNVGNRPLSECRRVLAPDAVYVAVGGGHGRWLGPMTHVLRTVAMGRFVSQKMIPVPARVEAGGLNLVRTWLEAGAVKPVIDRVYDGLPAVAEALRYLEQGHARGKVVIRIGSE